MAAPEKKNTPGSELESAGKRKNPKNRRKTLWLVISGLVVLGVILAIYLVVQRRSNAAAEYQTTQLIRGTLTATIGATGNVHAQQSVNLNWQTSGTVETVTVEVGDQVQAGDILASLLPSSLPQNVILAQADLVSAQKNLETVLESGTQRSQAQVNLVNAQKSVDSAQSNLDSLQATHHGGTGEDVTNARAQITLAQQRVTAAETWYNAVKFLGDEDPDKAAAVTNLYTAKQNLEAAQNNLDYFLLVPNKHDVELAQAKLALAESQLVDAEKEWARLKDGPDPKDIAAAQARVDAAQATLNNSHLTAPFAGTVTQAEPLAGDQVFPNSAGFRLDDLSHMLIDVQVSEVDINNVTVGQDVAVTFDAVLGIEYHGKVVDVSSVGNSVQGVVNFQVTVELTDADDYVKPGMTASVTIKVQSLDDVLLIPNRAVHLVKGQRVVYVLRGGILEEIPVTLGASDDINSALEAGDLTAGDLVVLNPPTDFTPGEHNNPGRFFGGG